MNSAFEIRDGARFLLEETVTSSDSGGRSWDDETALSTGKLSYAFYDSSGLLSSNACWL